jgi:hypothetical protein
MNFMGILLAVSIVTALFGFYCATKNASNAKNSKAEGRGRSVGPHRHFVDQKHLSELYESEPHYVSFRLQGSQTIEERSERPPQHLGITLQELEMCIPWIPGDCRVFISSPDGFRPSLLKQLKALHTKRDLFLIESLPQDLSSIRMVVS